MTKRFANPFPTLHINDTAAGELEHLADVFVRNHIAEYERFRADSNGRVDEARWKFVSELGNCRAYGERRGANSSTAPGSDYAVHTDTPVADLPTILVTGTIDGDLDDTIYGYICPTLDMMRIKTAYVDDHLIGAHVLATLVKPTPSDPFRALVVKWMEKGQRAAVRAVVKNRDFVYMESTGTEVLRNGERVGYQLIHSVQFPETPALDTCTRGNMSMCAVYRQKDAKTTEVFIKGFLNPAGGLMRSLVLRSAAQALLSVSNNAHCAQMKKLVWSIRQQRALGKTQGDESGSNSISSSSSSDRGSGSAMSNDTASESSTDRVNCCGCGRSAHNSSMPTVLLAGGKKKHQRRRTCKVCYNHVCSKCRQQHTLHFMLPDRRLVRQDVSFCPGCVMEAMEVKTLVVARDEVQFSDLYNWSDVYASSSSGAELTFVDDLN